MAFFYETEMKIPDHLAIILDGNGRWALKQGFIRSVGHQMGAKVMKNIVNYAFECGVKYLSLFCFSTENWKRDKNEIDTLMELPVEYFKKYEKKLLEDEVKVIFSGDLTKLPLKTKLACESILLKTKGCQRHILNICLNYGSHDEIIRAVKNIAQKVQNHELEIANINEEVFNQHLYSKDLPPIDLLIRTSNEKRLSNFMLFQMAYAEIYFTPVLWPAFKKSDLRKAFIEYKKRNRRFGGV